MFLFISKTFVVFGLVLCQRSCEVVCSANISLIVRLSYRSVVRKNVRCSHCNLHTCLCSISVLSVRSLSLWKLNNIFKLCIGSEVRHSNASAPELPSLYTSIVPLHVPLLRFGGFQDVMTYLVNLLILLSTSLYSEGEWYTVINGDNMLVGSNTPSSQKKESITCKTKKREKMKLWSIYGRSPRQQEHRKWMIPLWELGRSSLLDVGNGWVAFSQWRSLEQAKHIL